MNGHGECVAHFIRSLRGAFNQAAKAAIDWVPQLRKI
jgi:hypothetical protein